MADVISQDKKASKKKAHKEKKHLKSESEVMTEAIQEDTFVKRINGLSITTSLSPAEKDDLLRITKEYVTERIRLSREVPELKARILELEQRIDDFKREHDGCISKDKAVTLRQERDAARAAQHATEIERDARPSQAQFDDLNAQLAAAKNAQSAAETRAAALDKLRQDAEHQRQALLDQLAAERAAREVAERQRDARANISPTDLQALRDQLAAARNAQHAAEARTADLDRLRQDAEHQRDARANISPADLQALREQLATAIDKAARRKADRNAAAASEATEKAAREAAERAAHEATAREAAAREAAAREAAARAGIDANVKLLYTAHRRGESYSLRELLVRFNEEERQAIMQRLLQVSAEDNNPQHKMLEKQLGLK